MLVPDIQQAFRPVIPQPTSWSFSRNQLIYLALANLAMRKPYARDDVRG